MASQWSSHKDNFHTTFLTLGQAILTWHLGVNHHHVGGSPRARLLHCTTESRPCPPPDARQQSNYYDLRLSAPGRKKPSFANNLLLLFQVYRYPFKFNISISSTRVSKVFHSATENVSTTWQQTKTIQFRTSSFQFPFIFKTTSPATTFFLFLFPTKLSRQHDHHDHDGSQNKADLTSPNLT